MRADCSGNGSPEIIVVDGGSSDGTVQLAQKAGCKVCGPGSMQSCCTRMQGLYLQHADALSVSGPPCVRPSPMPVHRVTRTGAHACTAQCTPPLSRCNTPHSVPYPIVRKKRKDPLYGQVITTSRGRGHQLNVGWRATSRPWCLFLHGDSKLPAGYSEALSRCVCVCLWVWVCTRARCEHMIKSTLRVCCTSQVPTVCVCAVYGRCTGTCMRTAQPASVVGVDWGRGGSHPHVAHAQPGAQGLGLLRLASGPPAAPPAAPSRRLASAPPAHAGSPRDPSLPPVPPPAG